MDSDPDFGRATACLWWRTPNQVQTPNKGGPLEVGERERELNEMMEKGGSTPPYIGQGGLPPSSNFPCGTKPKGRGGGAPYGGWAPPLAPWAKGGASLLPLMGPKGPICLFPI